MLEPLLSIDTAATLQPAADVVVIGGGIVGACTAYYLARRGMKVALVEKGRIGAEQSSRNWGWCRQQNRNARELPMATASLTLWETMGGEIGESVGFRRTGLRPPTAPPAWTEAPGPGFGVLISSPTERHMHNAGAVHTWTSFKRLFQHGKSVNSVRARVVARRTIQPESV